jgi:gas vesicle protein
MGNGSRVQNRHILDAVTAQSTDFKDRLDKMERRLSNDIKTVKADCEGDVERVERKVEKLEDTTRKENIVGTVIGAAIGSFASFIAYVSR